MRELVEGKAAFVCDMRVREEGNIGNRVVADKEIIVGQMSLHNFQCRPAAVAPNRKGRGPFRRVRLVLQKKPGGCEVRFVAVLLEKQPLKH